MGKAELPSPYPLNKSSLCLPWLQYEQVQDLLYMTIASHPHTTSPPSSPAPWTYWPPCW